MKLINLIIVYSSKYLKYRQIVKNNKKRCKIIKLCVYLSRNIT